MRKVIMQLELTLDGFYANPNGGMDDWFRLDPEAWRVRVEQFEQIDTVVLGRKNYEGFHGYWPSVTTNPEASETDIKFSRWLENVSKVVFSKTLEKADWQNSRLATDVMGEISRLKEQSGKDILIMSSSSIAQACMKHDLLDEYWLTLHPVAIGEGKALFTEKVELELLASKTYPSGQVFLHYKTARAAS